MDTGSQERFHEVTGGGGEQALHAGWAVGCENPDSAADLRLYTPPMRPADIG